MADQGEESLSLPLLNGNRLQVTDVYEIATKIGLEFQKIIDEYGSATVTNIIPMIVSALEQLENVVGENEQLRLEHCKLALKSDKLEARQLRAKTASEQEETIAALEEKSRQLKNVQQSNNELQERVKQLEAALAKKNEHQALESERNKSNVLSLAIVYDV